MRKIAMILCLAILAGSFSGCASEQAYVPTGDALEAATQATEEAISTEPGESEAGTQDFTMAYYEQDGFNPYLCSGYTNRLFFSLIYQGLFSVGRDYHVEPMLCRSYSVSSDMRRFTFYLERATFSDGSYVTAQDVADSLQAARDSDVYGGRFTHIASVEVVAEDAVSITTTTAYENLPLLLDIPILKSLQLEQPMPVGTGPYVLVQSGGTLALHRRSDWWCDVEIPVTAQTVLLRKASDAVQIRDWFEFSDLGVAYADPGAGSYADYRCDYEVWDCETGMLVYLGYSADSEVFSNEEVRAALPYAIDRQRLLEECYNGFGHEAVLAASAGSPYYDKGLAGQVDYDPEHFRTVLAKNGMQGSTVSLLVNKSDSVRLEAAQKIAQMLTDCGLVVEIMDHSTSHYLQRIYAGTHDLYLGQTRLPANMDLSEFFRPYGNMSYGGMSDPTIYTMCLDALENSGNYYNLHQLVLKDSRLTPILFRTYAVYMKRGLMDGLSPARDNVFWYSIGKTMEDALITE